VATVWVAVNNISFVNNNLGFGYEGRLTMGRLFFWDSFFIKFFICKMLSIERKTIGIYKSVEKITVKIFF